MVAVGVTHSGVVVATLEQDGVALLEGCAGAGRHKGKKRIGDQRKSVAAMTFKVLDREEVINNLPANSRTVRGFIYVPRTSQHWAFNG